MKRNAPNEPAESEPPKAKPKKRSPMLAAASAAQKHAKLAEQIARAQSNVIEWVEEQRRIVGALDPDARAIFDRMVGDD